MPQTPPREDAAAAAERCSRTPSCLAQAESEIRALSLRAARKTLGLRASGDVPRTATARWLNAAGLLLLLAGHHERALAHLEAARALPFGAVHLNIDKNRHWAAHLSPEPDRAYADVEIPGAELVSTFKRLAAFVDGDPDDVAEVEASSGVSVYDLPVQRRICEHPMYDSQRGRHKSALAGADASTRWRRRYFDLLQRSLLRYLTRDLTEDVNVYRGGDADALRSSCEASAESGACEAPWHIGQGAYVGASPGPYSGKALGGLLHLEILLDDVLRRGVAGDVLEAGVFHAGTSVFLRAMLNLEEDLEEEAEGAEAEEEGGSARLSPLDPRRQAQARHAAGGRRRRRQLYLADSFAGIPMPRTERAKAIDTTAEWEGPYRYVVGLEAAKSTLRRYGMLDERVTFVEGYFNETLGDMPAEALALIHIDADAYDSVHDALVGAYDRLSPGGHVVIDDWHLPGVRAAVHDFRAARYATGAAPPLLPVPVDHVTSCAPQWGTPQALTIHRLSVAWWTKG